MGELCTGLVNNTWGWGVAVLLKHGVTCLGSVVEEHWLAVVVRNTALGDMVVVAAHLPPSLRGTGSATYGNYWVSWSPAITLSFGVV